jgi:hypothetical protein
MSVDKSWLLNAQIKLNNGFEVAGFGIEVHGFGSSLGGFDVRSGESFNLWLLKSPIKVIETF